MDPKQVSLSAAWVLGWASLLLIRQQVNDWHLEIWEILKWNRKTESWIEVGKHIEDLQNITKTNGVDKQANNIKKMNLRNWTLELSKNYAYEAEPTKLNPGCSNKIIQKMIPESVQRNAGMLSSKGGASWGTFGGPSRFSLCART